MSPITIRAACTLTDLASLPRLEIAARRQSLAAQNGAAK
jgi:hypothetical protein